MGMKGKNKTDETSVHGNENECTDGYYPHVEDQETIIPGGAVIAFVGDITNSLSLSSAHM